MIATLEIIDENLAPYPWGEVSAYSPPAVEALSELADGKLLLCQPGQPALSEIFSNSHHIDSIEAAGKAVDEGRDILVVGDRDFVHNFEREAERLYVLRVHTETAEVEGSIYPEPGGQWRERSRELIWSGNDETQPSNCSLIAYTLQPSARKISVVISTYNQVEWLEKTLWGYQAQDCKHFELIVADDGSNRATYDMLRSIAPQLDFEIRHVWHPDNGFRKCDILDEAILACATDYLLFSDGDCIPRQDFVSTHLRLRRPGRFLSNGYYKLSMPLSQLISKEDILSGRCFDLKWLRKNGLPRTFKNNKFTARGVWRWMLNTFTPTKASWNGHGSSAYLSDILAANGFDRRMKYGGEDRELGERLENGGIRGKQIRYSTVCIHLDHKRGYVSDEDWARNREIRQYTKRNRVKRTPFGIVREEK